MLDGERVLSASFPEVKVTTKSGFAHNRGMMTTIEGVTIKGQAWEDQGDVLAGIVASRKGWSTSGGRSDEDILRVAEAFVKSWVGALNEDLLNEATAPEDLAQALAALMRPFPSYHPPKAGIYKLDDGERIVVVSFFERGFIGMRGRNWSYQVWAFRVSDGHSYTVVGEDWNKDRVTGPQPVDLNIPRPSSFSERG